MPFLAFGILLAGLLFLLLNWWAKAEVKSAKRGLFGAVIGVALVLGIILFGRAGPISAFAPVVFVAWRMFNAARISAKRDGRMGTGQRRSGSMTRKEALEIFGLGEGATQDDIKTAFKRLMAQCHPDKGGSNWMAAQLNEAKRILVDK